MAIAPIGAYLAVAGKFDWLPLVLSLVVFFWVSGFDIIYALQDEEFDIEQELKSVPAYLGKTKAMNVAKTIHILSALFVFTFAVLIPANWIQVAGSVVFIGLVFYQHTLVKPTDLSKVNLAFFTTNGIASVLYGISLIAGLYI